MKFSVYPTSYLHLLLHPAATPVQVKPFVQFEADINQTGVGLHPKIMNDLSGTPPLFPGIATSYVNFDASKVTIVNGEFTPVAAGDTFGIIRVTDTPLISQPANVIITESAFRVKVHDKIDEFWIGNNSITMHEGQSNYVISVFARFSDGSFGDISYHPYLKFTSADSTKLEVDAEGRLKAKKKGNTVTVTVEHAGVSKTIDVKIIDPVSTVKKVLELIHGAGNHEKKKNILLLSEGFADTADDKALFETLTTNLIQNELFVSAQTSPYSPYHHLTDEFLVWRAFVPSPEAGITLLNPVLADGTPIDKETDHEQHLHGYVQANDSFFGYGLGGRFSEKSAFSPSTGGANARTMWFILDDAARTVSKDTKRMDNTWDKQLFMYEFVRSLRPVSSIASNSPYQNVFKMWSKETGFKDSVFICFIIKEEYRAGTNSRKIMAGSKFAIGSLALSMGKGLAKNTIAVRAATNRIIDHKPKITTFAAYKPDLHDITATMAHEFAHSMRIGDEYEDIDNRGHAALPPADSAGLTLIQQDGFINLMDYDHIKHATLPYPAIDPDKIIWNWHLIETGSLLTANAVLDSTKKKMTLTLLKGENAKYAVGDEVIVRDPLMNIDPANLKNGITEVIKITKLTSGASSDKMELLSTIAISFSFLKGSLLFKPLKNKTGVIQTLMIPEVLAELKLRGRPFNLPANQPAKATRSNADNEKFGDAYEYPGAITGIPIIRSTSYLTGLFEGGGTYNTRVYRPTGWGMMRGGRRMSASNFIVLSEMSMVNKYIIVNQINPVLLSKLNAELGEKQIRNL